MKEFYRVYYDDKHKSDGTFTFLTNTGKVVTLPYYAYEEEGVLRDVITNEIVTMKRSFESDESLQYYIKTKVKNIKEVLDFVMLLRDNRVYYYNYVNQILMLSGKRENNNSKAEQSILDYYNKVNELKINL